MGSCSKGGAQKQRRAFHVEPVEKRGRGPGGQRRLGQPEGPRNAPGQPLAEDQQHHAQHRRQDRAAFQQDRRQKVLGVDLVGPHRGHQRHEDQPGPHAEGGQPGQRRRRLGGRGQHRAQRLGRLAQKPGDEAAGLARLVHRDEGQRQREGQQVVDDPVEQQRRGDLLERRLRRHRRDHHRLEHADPAGHVAQHPGHGGGREHRQEGQEVGRRGGQQHVERQRRHHRVDQREAELREQDARRGGRDLDAADAQAAIGGRKPDQQPDQPRRPGPGPDPDRRRGEGQDGPQRVGLDGQRRQADDGDAEAEGQRHEGRDAGHLEGVEPEGRVDAVAHRAPRHDADADGVAEAVAEEPAHRDDAQRDALAQMPQRRPVIADQRGVARRGRRQRGQKGRPGRGADLGDDVRRANGPEQVIERVDAQREQPQPQRHRNRPAPGRAGPARRLGLRNRLAHPPRPVLFRRRRRRAAARRPSTARRPG